MLLTESVDSDAQYWASVVTAERTNFILINLVGRGLKAGNQTLAGERLVSPGNKLDDKQTLAFAVNPASCATTHHRRSAV